MFARRVTHALARSDLADRVRSVLLPIVALAAVVQAGFTVNPTWGWLAVAMAAAVLDFLLYGEDEAEGADTPPSSMSTR